MRLSASDKIDELHLSEEEVVKEKQFKKALQFDSEAELVEALAVSGVSIATIATAIRRNKNWVLRTYRQEIERARAIAGAAVTRGILRAALTGSSADRIFYAKARLGWREVQQVDVSGGLKFELSINVGGTNVKEVNAIDVTPKTPADGDKK